MRKAAQVLLVLFVFAIPWEYSLDWGAPIGNIARILGLMAALAAVLAVLRVGRFRKVCQLHWLTLALYLWLCCSFFWTLTPQRTLAHLRGYAQEMMLVWLVWEVVESPRHLRVLLRAWLAGSWVLAILTIASFVSGDAAGLHQQIRFAAIGQDPNDVARFLTFGFPIAGLLLGETESRFERAHALGYFPLGFAGVLLTASRSGFLMALAAVTACGLAAIHRHTRGIAVGAVAVISAAALVFVSVPPGTLERLGTVTELWQKGDLNQRANIWSEGWRAFERAPIIGHGAGSFVTAAGLGADDTAHNTVLAILVETGLCGLVLATSVVAISIRAVGRTWGSLRTGLFLLMLVCGLSSLVGTVGENRMTWLLLGIVAVSRRLAENDPLGMNTLCGTGNWKVEAECVRSAR